MSRLPDVSALLVRALVLSAADAGCKVVAEARTTGWASATFIGAHHVISCRSVTLVTLGAWIDGLAEAEFALPGHLVADLAVLSRSAARADLEILTIEDDRPALPQPPVASRRSMPSVS